MSKAAAIRTSLQGITPARQLYRDICKNIGRVLTIYDLNITNQEARSVIADRFRQKAHIKDPRVIDVLVAKGYMDLEETLLQHKQRNHLMLILNPKEGKVYPGAIKEYDAGMMETIHEILGDRRMEELMESYNK